MRTIASLSNFYYYECRMMDFNVTAILGINIKFYVTACVVYLRMLGHAKIHNLKKIGNNL